ncbi:MAG: hypothetical protein CL947_04705 [Epsilonproteobacteria bacterium]|nr:hypothetical protein [Campylobacterota bacterium]|tara:strand:+ start:2495 stop:2941 length:447 start_codon:yes stop_codon:yes gene_type:complete
MKKEDLFQLAMMICSFSEVFVHAQQKKNIKSIDPIVDFRAPHSLLELLQDGLNTVYRSLQSHSFSNEVLQSVYNQLEELSVTYDNLVNTTRSHQVHSDDKSYLQSMIDRIDRLIAELENTSDEDTQEDKEMMRSVRSMCLSLKNKISE